MIKYPHTVFTVHSLLLKSTCPNHFGNYMVFFHFPVGMLSAFWTSSSFIPCRTYTLPCKWLETCNCALHSMILRNEKFLAPLPYALRFTSRKTVLTQRFLCLIFSHLTKLELSFTSLSAPHSAIQNNCCNHLWDFRISLM